MGCKIGSGNCQEFVESILNILGIKMDFKDPLNTFLRNMKLKGESHLIFKMKPEFMEYFSLKFDEIEFKTHSEIDEFVTYLLIVDESSEEKFKDEFMLLKGFDRAFWLKNNKLIGNISQLDSKIEKCQILISLSDGEERDHLRNLLDELIEERTHTKDDFINVKPNHSNSNIEICPFGNPSNTGSFCYLE